MRTQLLAIAVIVTVASGCDNVTWGGVEVHRVPPPTHAELRADDPAETSDDTGVAVPELPAGPILLAGSREGALATLTVVGDVRGDALGPFPSETEVPGYRDHFVTTLLPVGSEWTLFAQGVRVGRLTAAETGVADAFCVPRPTVSGTVELVPGAVGARRFLALPADAVRDRAYAEYRALDHDYDQRVASLTLAAAAIPRVGAAWPPSLLDSRADIQAFRLPDAGGPSIAATFVHQDRLSVARPGADAYALFLLGSDRGGGNYAEAFTWYRPAAESGKGAPRYFDHLDWNGDGTPEVLLDVFGAERRWFAALSRRPTGWTRTAEDPCGAPATSAGG